MHLSTPPLSKLPAPSFDPVAEWSNRPIAVAVDSIGRNLAARSVGVAPINGQLFTRFSTWNDATDGLRELKLTSGAPMAALLYGGDGAYYLTGLKYRDNGDAVVESTTLHSDRPYIGADSIQRVRMDVAAVMGYASFATSSAYKAPAPITLAVGFLSPDERALVG